MFSVLGDKQRIPSVGRVGVDALRQIPEDWLTFPARDRLRLWLENRKLRKQVAQALDDALEALAETLTADPEAPSLEDMFAERFFSDRQVMGTLVACFSASEPVDYTLLARNVSFGTEPQRRRVLEAFVAQLRAYLAAANPDFRLSIPVQSAARVKAIQSAGQAQEDRQRSAPPDQRRAPTSAPPREPAASLAAPVLAASIQTTTKEKQERAMDQVGTQANGDVGQRLALAVELEAQGRTQEAMALYQSLLRQFPDNGKAHFNLAVLLTEQGRLDEALGHCRVATQSLPDYPDAWGLNAYLLSLLHHDRESLESARKAVALGFPRKRLAGLLKLAPAAL